MKKTFILLSVMTFCIACGPSVAEFENLKSENAVLKAQVDSLSQELDAFKYSPEKLLADAQLAAKSEDIGKLRQIHEQMNQYHPQAAEGAKVQKLMDEIIARDQARAKAELQKAEKEKQERLKAVNKLKKERDDVQGITWYYNPYFTHYNNRNLVSLYMGKSSSNVWLRLKMSYTGDDWIFFENAYLSYDGITREFPFNKYKDKNSDNSGGDVWEWIDLGVSNDDLAFLKNMVNGKSIKMQLRGKYTKTRTVSANEIKAIREMILAYEVLLAEH